MSNPKPVTIIGGGLAGLTLGIGLRQGGVPVTVWEAGHYPRHRVCGEFVSGRGQQVLRRLGLEEIFVQAGATRARTAAFYMGLAATPVRSITPPALCLSRFLMDALLARQFRQRGGELREGARWVGPASGEGIVCATGRRLQPAEKGWRWFGLKVHARRVRLAADLEMHGLPNGYVGLCRLNEGEANVCGLFRRRVGAPALTGLGAGYTTEYPGNTGAPKPAKAGAPGAVSECAQREVGGARLEVLRGEPGTALHARLRDAVFEPGSFCSVAGLSLQPARAFGRTECCLGDALTMIPPVTGNGMSMAFEAAELALEPVAAYSRGELTWNQTQRTVAEDCDRTFAQRLAWAAWLQRMMFAPALRGKLGRWVLGSECVWRVMFDRTRQEAGREA